MNKHARPMVACRSAAKEDACQSKKARTIITILLALVAVTGWAQKVWTNPGYRNEPHGFQFDVNEVEFLPADQQHAVEQYVGLTGYPTYRLFDKQGRMHHLNWLDDENLPEFKKKLDAME